MLGGTTVESKPGVAIIGEVSVNSNMFFGRAFTKITGQIALY